MRNEFAAAVVKAKAHHDQLIFITGDLGYMALEEVQKTFREHFINAGVAEQNMITLAAGLAHEGFIPFVYSIAPFIVLRPYEQIRNDICLHHLPVKLVGNGGGYGYGIMGATHHTLEDIAAMRMLPGMRVYVPLISDDVEVAVMKMIQDSSPNYLRLNLAAKLANNIPSFAPWRHLNKGRNATVIGTGPVIQNVVNFFPELDYWYAGIFPISDLPEQLINSVEETKKVIVVEEHYGEGGLRETISFHLLNALSTPISILSLSAAGYPSGKYGSQLWHQEENTLAGEALKHKIQKFLAERT